MPIILLSTHCFPLLHAPTAELCIRIYYLLAHCASAASMVRFLAENRTVIRATRQIHTVVFILWGNQYADIKSSYRQITSNFKLPIRGLVPVKKRSI